MILAQNWPRGVAPLTAKPFNASRRPRYLKYKIIWPLLVKLSVKQSEQ